jgi:hypothetical protein
LAMAQKGVLGLFCDPDEFMANKLRVPAEGPSISNHEAGQRTPFKGCVRVCPG